MVDAVWSGLLTDYKRRIICGADGTRTRDPRTASAVRYQLRYSPDGITTGRAAVRRPPYTRPGMIPYAGSAVGAAECLVQPLAFGCIFHDCTVYQHSGSAEHVIRP